MQKSGPNAASDCDDYEVSISINDSCHVNFGKYKIKNEDIIETA